MFDVFSRCSSITYGNFWTSHTFGVCSRYFYVDLNIDLTRFSQCYDTCYWTTEDDNRAWKSSERCGIWTNNWCFAFIYFGWISLKVSDIWRNASYKSQISYSHLDCYYVRFAVCLSTICTTTLKHVSDFGCSLPVNRWFKHYANGYDQRFNSCGFCHNVPSICSLLFFYRLAN